MSSEQRSIRSYASSYVLGFGIGGSCTRLHRPLIIFNGISNKECSDEGSVLYSHESTGNTSTYYSTSVPRYIDPNWLDGCMTWAAMTDRYVRTIGRTTGEEVVHRMPIDASCSTHALEDRTRGPYHTNIIGCKGMICRHRRRVVRGGDDDCTDALREFTVLD